MRISKLIVSAFFLLSAPLAMATPIYTGAASDPTGDSSACCDITGISAVVDDLGMVTFSARFDAGGFDSSVAQVAFSLDTDQDVSTGHPGVTADGNTDGDLLGSDYLVWMGGGDPTAQVLVVTGFNTVSNVGTASTTILSDGFDTVVPLSLLGSDDGLFNFKATSSQCTSSGAGPACANFGVIDIATDEGLAPVATLAVPAPAPLALLAFGLSIVAFGRRK